MNPPVPTALRILRGNPSKRPLPEDEPQPPAGAPMPDGLSEGAARHWPKIAKILEDCGVLTAMDVAALALYCETFARWRHASDQLARFGPLIKGRFGPSLSPYLLIADKSHAQMVTLLREFGMTPSARTRVRAQPSKAKKSRLLTLLHGDEKR